MKTLISLLLIICLICPLLSGCVNQDSDLRMKKAYLRQFKIKDVEPEDVVIDYDGGIYNGARIVMLDAEWHEPEIKTEYFGKSVIDYYDNNEILVYKFGYFFNLKKAYSFSIISEEDYAQIAKDYRADIKSFMDVCDKHDFEPCQEIHLGTDHIDYLGHSDKCCDCLWVYLDGKLLSGLSDHLKEDREKIVKYINSYLETDLVSHISYLVDYQQNLDMWVTKIYINNDNTENLSQIMEQLSSVPGITKLYCHCLLVKIGV